MDWQPSWQHRLHFRSNPVSHELSYYFPDQSAHFCSYGIPFIVPYGFPHCITNHLPDPLPDPLPDALPYSLLPAG